MSPAVAFEDRRPPAVDRGSLLSRLRPGQRGMATHVAWIARDFGRRDMSPLSNADVDALGRVLEPIRVEAGRRILSPGDPADAAYIVEEGEVELAVLLGASRQSVNRALRELSKDGLVRQRYGEIEILDADRILELAGEGAFLRGVC